MHPSPILDLKPFVPAVDHGLSTRFYLDLGFTRTWGDDQVAEFQVGGFRFLLQSYNQRSFSEHYMMHLMVEDADPWWRRIEQIGLAATYPGIMARAPAVQPWGLRVLYLSDPSGVLWHIADPRKA